LSLWALGLRLQATHVDAALDVVDALRVLACGIHAGGAAAAAGTGAAAAASRGGAAMARGRAATASARPAGGAAAGVGGAGAGGGLGGGGVRVRVHRRGVGRVVVVLGSGRRVVIVVLGRAAVDRGEVNGAVNEHVRTGREALALAGVHDAVAQAELEVVRLRPRLAVGRDCEHVGGAQRRHVHFQVLYKEALGLRDAVANIVEAPDKPKRSVAHMEAKLGFEGVSIVVHRAADGCAGRINGASGSHGNRRAGRTCRMDRSRGGRNEKSAHFAGVAR